MTRGNCSIGVRESQRSTAHSGRSDEGRKNLVAHHPMKTIARAAEPGRLNVGDRKRLWVSRTSRPQKSPGARLLSNSFRPQAIPTAGVHALRTIFNHLQMA